MPVRLYTNQNGMILVLAMFMLALLSMIGIASMMTSTTDIEIATGERQYVETFYRAQASHTIAGELLLAAMWDRGLEGFETIDPDGNRVDFDAIDDYAFAFRVLDPDLLLEDFDSVSATVAGSQMMRIWQVDQQTVDELPCPPELSESECKALDAQISSQGFADFDLWTDVRLVGVQDGQQVVLADIDIDKIHSRTIAGGGAEFASKDLGPGSNMAVLNYNIDARARLSNGDFTRSPSRQALGMRVVK